eukprot:gnl/TRDRNA2_/TRDRNA2_80213_c0_seq1.p1 gnl/TRDRNA2_/TRDRNA2_80213_c0~~gnl/TRDRNA2_/TRDRNA2_80213_c0_seq1.p1  ORF type:complete len:296 (+),score=54.31 gnl/TRDRNA2_/TRDRNA2_80213_c0_seq1:87-974(+)
MGVSQCCLRHDEDFVAFQETGSTVKMLIVALNYDYSKGNELTARDDAVRFVQTAERAGVEDVTVLTDEYLETPGFPSQKAVLDAIRDVASRCEEGDWFFFFYAGHGENVPDLDGDEEDGLDEAFVTPNTDGNLAEKFWLVDDDFAIALDKFVPAGVRIMCICDCCHSGTIADIDSHAYDHEIYAISAAQDDEEAVDTGRGGVLTTAIHRAIRELSARYGSKEFSVAELFDATNRYAKLLTDRQELEFQWSGSDPAMVAWPMCFPWWMHFQGTTQDLDELTEEYRTELAARALRHQ